MDRHHLAGRAATRPPKAAGTDPGGADKSAHMPPAARPRRPARPADGAADGRPGPRMPRRLTGAISPPRAVQQLPEVWNLGQSRLKVLADSFDPDAAIAVHQPGPSRIASAPMSWDQPKSSGQSVKRSWAVSRSRRRASAMTSTVLLVVLPHIRTPRCRLAAGGSSTTQGSPTQPNTSRIWRGGRSLMLRRVRRRQ